MKNIITSAILSVAASLLAGPAPAAPAEGYVAEVVLKRGGEVVAQSKGPAGANGTIRNVVDNSRAYRKSVTTSGDRQAVERAQDTLKTGMSYMIALKGEGDGMTVDAVVKYTELVAMDVFSVAGETIDLPNVNAWSLVEGGAAKRDGNGWRYETVNDHNGLALSVTLRPAGI
jgi:hypothetical protein